MNAATTGTDTSTGTSTGAEHPDARSGRLRGRIWRVIARSLPRIPFAEDVLAAWYCAADRDTPSAVRLTLLGALAYFVMPLDAIPDVLAVAGFVDDASVIAIALTTVGAHLKPKHRFFARKALRSLGESAEMTPPAKTG